MANYSADSIITLNVTENPKHKYNATGGLNKAYQRFSLYRNGLTVAEYKRQVLALPTYGGKGYAAADLAWDTEHGFITIGQVAQAEAPQANVTEASNANVTEADVTATEVAAAAPAEAPAPVKVSKRKRK